MSLKANGMRAVSFNGEHIGTLVLFIDLMMSYGHRSCGPSSGGFL